MLGHADFGERQFDPELRTVTDELRPLLVTAVTVVFPVLMALTLAVPVPSVDVVEGVTVPAPIAKATVTFGTARPLALSTWADIVRS